MILSGLFQIRSKSILGLSAEDSARSYLSGMIISCEIAESAAGGFTTSQPVLVIGGKQLADIYLLGLKLAFDSRRYTEPVDPYQ